MIGAGSSAFQHLGLRVAQLVARDVHGLFLTDPIKTALVASRLASHKASVLGFENGFVAAGLVILLGIPISLLLKRPAGPARPLAGRS
ncbi:MAG: hypothetical protein KKB20_29070 [Proteobacteria bacterium]|nr:hypothetical protein [Pseudomonadota bacterium]